MAITSGEESAEEFLKMAYEVRGESIDDCIFLAVLSD